MSRRSPVLRAPVSSLAAAADIVHLRYSRALLYADRAHGRAALASILAVFDSVLDGCELWIRRLGMVAGVVAAVAASALASASLLAWALATLH